MFLKSVALGFDALFYWEIWIAVLLYVSITMIFMASTGLLYDKNFAAGCLTHSFVLPSLNAIFSSILALFLLPIILDGNVGPLSFYISFFGELFLKIFLFTFIVFIVSHFIPFINSLLELHPGSTVFLIGCIFVYTTFSGFLSSEGVDTAGVFPSFWHILGYYIISLILFSLIFIFISFICATILKIEFASENIVVAFSIMFFAVWSGILPVFMYGRFIILSVWQAYGFF